MSPAAFVVTRPIPESGLGSNLASMAGAWWLAKRLGRDLIVDWRGMVFLRDPSINYFTQYFEPVSVIEGVRVHYAPSQAAGDHLAEPPDRVRPIAAGEHTALVAAGSAALPTYLVLTAYHGMNRMMRGDFPAGRERERRVFEAVELRPEVQAKADAFYDANFSDSIVIGVNIATGNLSPTGTRSYFGRFDTSILADRERFLRQVHRATRLCARRLPRDTKETRIFYSTESDWMAELLSRLPDARTRRRVFPPTGVGRFFADYDALGYSDVEASEDMVIDHFLLSRCDALVYNGSMFNNYARVMTDSFDGNARNIESLYLRYWLRTAAARTRSVMHRPQAVGGISNPSG